MFTGSLGLKARQIGRVLGINRILARLLVSDAYEARYAAAITRCIRVGDSVWDIGANVGHYAVSFSYQVGISGRVFAFEPSPRNLAPLHERTLVAGNVVVLPFALSDKCGQFSFKEEADGTTSHIAADNSPGDVNELITVNLRTGDEMISRGDAAFPNIVKIDVEGYELEVLLGLSTALRDPRLRCVFVEVHFAILQERGMRAAPRQIEQMLIANGFRVSWTDPSHIQAVHNC
jgi:FkbM family methyltransferase